MRTWIGLAAAALAIAPLCAAQEAARRPVTALMDEKREIELALSAAPPEVSRGADVYVLRRGGHVRVREGTTGVACLVARDHPESIVPICYDAEAARAVLPVELREQALRDAGRSEDEVRREIEAGYGRGEFRPPRRAAMSYMMSPEQVLYSSPTGRRVGAWHPHIMIYVPYATNADLALPGPQAYGEMFVVEEGTPRAHFIVKVREWAKPAPAAAR
ncbi:MAG TPA: hypothetical protein VKA84_21245 [Gemmatimonadaceae bacterium]|nr:hypothetical protein [Gemmatimonadaceae bacterium]